MTERFAFVYVLPFSFRYVVVQKIDYIFNKCFFHSSLIIRSIRYSFSFPATRPASSTGRPASVGM